MIITGKKSTFGIGVENCKMFINEFDVSSAYCIPIDPSVSLDRVYLMITLESGIQPEIETTFEQADILIEACNKTTLPTVKVS